MGEAKRKGKPDPATVEGLIEMARRHASQSFRDAEDDDFQLLPIWTAYGPEGLLVVGTPFEGKNADEAEAGKARIVKLMRAMFLCKGVTCYCLAVEAWTATQAPDPAINKLMPSQRQDRKEVVMFMGADRNGNKVARNYEIIREPGKKARIAEEQLHTGYDMIGGRMATVLDDLPVLPPDIQAEMSRTFDEFGVEAMMKMETPGHG